MDVGTAVVNFINQNGMAGSVLLFLAWFVVTRLWPFFTKEYWPTQNKRADARETLERTLRDNLIEIKGVIDKMNALVLENDRNARSDRQRIVETITRNDEAQRANARIILDSVAALHVRLEGIPLARTQAVEHALVGLEVRK